MVSLLCIGELASLAYIEKLKRFQHEKQKVLEKNLPEQECSQIIKDWANRLDIKDEDVGF